MASGPASVAQLHVSRGSEGLGSVREGSKLSKTGAWKCCYRLACEGTRHPAGLGELVRERNYPNFMPLLYACAVVLLVIVSLGVLNSLLFSSLSQFALYGERLEDWALGACS